MDILYIIATMESMARIPKAKRTVYALFVVAVVVLLVGDELTSPVLSPYLRRQSSSSAVVQVQTEEATEMHVPPTLDLQSQRQLSLNLGGGNCKWQPPVYEVPEEIEFYKTVIAGFPSGDKRMIFVQVSFCYKCACSII